MNVHESISQSRTRFCSVLMAVVLAVLSVDAQADQQSPRSGQDAPGMYSTYTDPAKVSLARRLGDGSAMPLEQLVPALLGAIDQLSKYRSPAIQPEIYRVARARIAELACPGPCSVRAIYHPGVGIYIDERMQPESDLFDRSVLLHELVHYVQDLANERGELEPCRRWYFREMEAYAIQKRFLVLVDSPVRVAYSGRPSPCDDSLGSGARDQ
jgi:hypothetical protein